MVYANESETLKKIINSQHLSVKDCWNRHDVNLDIQDILDVVDELMFRQAVDDWGLPSRVRCDKKEEVSMLCSIY